MKLKIVTTCTLMIALAAAASGQTPNLIAPAAYRTGGSSAFVTVADLNHDKIPDVVTYESASQSLSILFGNTDGTFKPPVSRGLGFGAASVEAVDLNGDGAADLVMCTGGVVAVLLNAGDGSFAPAAFYSAGISANYATARDINHDGVPDVIVAGANGFAVLRGLGPGTFASPVILPGAFSHFWVGVADFNGDGHLDLVGDGSPGQFYAGNGDRSFALPVAVPAIPYGAVVGDFNGDGKMDVAYLVNTFNQERIAGQQVSVLMGTGSGQFLDALDIFFSGSGSGQVAAGDFDGDGRTDLAIWLTATARVLLLTNMSGAQFTGVPIDLGSVGNANLTAADVDGNGSKDLLLLSPTAVTLLRNTHGNPALLALATVAPVSVTGGATAQGTVTLGGPAPAGGAVVTLASSAPSLAHPTVSTVTIPPGATTTTFPVSTSPVIGSSSVTITAECNFVAQAAVLTLVAPYSLSGLTVNPASQFGGFTTQGTIVLSGPADSSATVQLSSSNAALVSVPASVTVVPGATAAAFPVALQPVSADTPVSVTASMGGIDRTAGLTVLHPLDSVRITKAEYTVRALQLKVEAASSSANASVTVWNASTGALIGSLANAGGGKYTGTFTVSPAVLSITVKSNLGGVATGPAAQK